MAVVKRPSQPAAQAPAPPKPPPFLVGRPMSAEERWLNLLIYGDYGAGKTTLAASAHDVESMRDVFLIAAEAGDLSIASRKKIGVVGITTYRMLARIYEYLRLYCRYRDAGDDDKLLELAIKYHDPSSGPEPTVAPHYYTVIIDSLSEVQKYLMYQLLGITIGEAPLDEELIAAQTQDWQVQIEMFRMLIRSFRDLPMHVIFVLQEEDTTPRAPQGKVQKPSKYQPRLPGKLAKEVQGFMDMVGYLQHKKVPGGEGEKLRDQRRLYLASGYPFWSSKHRFEHVQVDYLDNPTMSSILELDRKEAQLASAAATTNSSRSTSNSSSPGRTAGPARPASPSVRSDGQARRPTPARAGGGTGGRAVRRRAG